MMNDKVDNYIMQENHRHLVPATTEFVANNTTSVEFEGVKPESMGLIAGLVTFYGVIAFIAITTNIFILYSIFRKLVPKNTVNMFLGSLAISDLIMVSLSLFDCFAYINGGWIFGEWSCKIQSFFLEVCFTASTLTLVSVSVERYFLICHPHMKRRSMRVIYYVVILLWIMGAIICCPLLHGYVVYRDVNYEAKKQELVCANKNWADNVKRSFYIIYSLIIYLIPLFIMTFAHWRISVQVKVRRPSAAATTLMIQDENSRQKEGKCYTIREESSVCSDATAETSDGRQKPQAPAKMFNSLSALRRKGSTMEKDLNRRERVLKAIRLLFVVTVVFIVLWTPFIVLRLILLLGFDVNEYVYKFSEVLILSSTAVNGIIYAFMSMPFRKAFLSILCCRRRSDVISRDSAPSISNSDDNKFSQRMSRTSVYSHPDSRHSTLPTTPRTFLVNSGKADV